MSRVVVLSMLVLGLVAVPATASACSKLRTSLFEEFEGAVDVAVVKVGTVPRGKPRYAGPVALRVVQRFKGRAGRRLVANETNSTCAAGFRTGRTALIFLSADRWPLDYLERPSPATVAVMTAWAAASTPADRAAVLVATIAGGDPALSADAAYYLADEPALIAALTPAQTATLVATRDRHTERSVLVILARQHGQAWRDVVAEGRWPARDRVAARQLRPLVDTDLEAITDVAALAAMIDQTPGEAAPLRIAAMERCERIHGKRLAGFTRYAGGRDEWNWPKLAQACRTGTAPVP